MANPVLNDLIQARMKKKGNTEPQYGVIESYNFDAQIDVVLFPVEKEAIDYAKRRFEQCMESERKAQAELPEEDRCLMENECSFDEEVGTGIMTWENRLLDTECNDCPCHQNSIWRIEVAPVIKPRC